MIAEVEVLLHVDDVVQVVLVFPLYDVENLQLHQSLVMKPAHLQQTERLAIYFSVLFFCFFKADTEHCFFTWGKRSIAGFCFLQSVFHKGDTFPHWRNVTHPKLRVKWRVCRFPEALLVGSSHPLCYLNYYICGRTRLLLRAPLFL